MKKILSKQQKKRLKEAYQELKRGWRRFSQTSKRIGGMWEEMP
ncbi:MAG: hypothetical protein WD876_01290 [Candidatus Pacearchaeota archaeon]